MRLKRITGILVILLSVVIYYLLFRSLWEWDPYNLIVLLYERDLASLIVLVREWGSINPAILFWSFLYFAFIMGMFFAVFSWPSRRGELPTGRIVAIVPVYNENQRTIEMMINSLLAQSVEIDEIHIIDDGSDIPMKEFEYPRVFCHRQKSMGKRCAQASVLSKINPKSADFILTVDAKTQLNIYAVEHLLRAMKNPRVQSCTSAVLTSNYNSNMISIVQEFSYGIAGIIAQYSKKMLGFLELTAGACSLYRGEILYYYLGDYLKSGIAGNDRRLRMYSVMEGKALYVPEAIVYTEAPQSLRQLWKQRVRWNISTWRSIPFFLGRMGFRGFIYSTLNYFNLIIGPLIVGLIAYGLMVDNSIFMTNTYVFMIEDNAHAIYIPMLLIYSAISFLIIAYLQSFLFILTRPNWTFAQRIGNWLVVTPVLCLYTIFIFGPARYFALLKLNNKEWGMRGTVSMKAKLETYMQNLQVRHERMKEQHDIIATVCGWLEERIKELEEKLDESAGEREVLAEECEGLEGQIKGLEEELKESLELEEAMAKFQEEFEEKHRQLEEELNSSQDLQKKIFVSVRDVRVLLEKEGIGAYSLDDGKMICSEDEEAELLAKIEEDLKERPDKWKSKKGHQRAQKLSRKLRDGSIQRKKAT